MDKNLNGNRRSLVIAAASAGLGLGGFHVASKAQSFPAILNSGLKKVL